MAGRDCAKVNRRKGRSVNHGDRELGDGEAAWLFGIRGGRLEARFDRAHGMRGGEAVFLAQVIDAGSVFDKLVGPADAQERRGNGLVSETFGDEASVAA